MKVIDLLNKIASGEEVPNKIKVGMFELTLSDDGKYYAGETFTVLNDVYGMHSLNDEIEIIEEDKPIEKLDYEINENNVDTCTEKIRCKINELIDEINKLKKENDIQYKVVEKE